MPDRPSGPCKRCGRNGRTAELNVHHVLMKDDPRYEQLEHKVVLCAPCHHEWHKSFEGATDFLAWLASPTMFFVIQSLNAPGVDELSVKDLKELWCQIREFRTLEARLETA
jgi:hypothetical protein